MADTKKCEACDVVIGKTETKCPACGVDLEELEEAVKVVERANAIIEKRKKAALPPAPVKKTGLSLFGRKK